MLNFSMGHSTHTKLHNLLPLCAKCTLDVEALRALTMSFQQGDVHINLNAVSMLYEIAKPALPSRNCKGSTI